MLSNNSANTSRKGRKDNSIVPPVAMVEKRVIRRDSMVVTADSRVGIRLQMLKIRPTFSPLAFASLAPKTIPMIDTIGDTVLRAGTNAATIATIPRIRAFDVFLVSGAEAGLGVLWELF